MMFGLEEDWLTESYVDTREPFEKIRVEANGGIDVSGEWQFSGSYQVSVYPKDIGNCYAYAGSISKGWKKHSRWRVHLSVCGGMHNRVRVTILSKTVPSIKQARKMIVQTIMEYEKNSHFREEVAPQIYDEDLRTPILKEIEGELYWIASTWESPYSVIQGKTYFSHFEKPFGNGQFYYRKRQWSLEYPMGKDGRKNYDAEPERVYEAPQYGNVEASCYSISGSSSKAQEKKHEINKAIFDVTDQQMEKIQKGRYLSLKRV